MLYLLLSIAAMAALALVLRAAMAAGAHALGINLVFRTTAALSAAVTAVLVLDAEDVAVWPAVAVPGAAGAVLFFLAGLGSIKAVQLGHLGLSWGVLRCSMLLPVAASIVVWNEVPLWPVSSLLLARVAGMATACAAIAMVARGQMRGGPGAAAPGGGSVRTWLLWLGLAFVAQGGWEIVLRSTRQLPDDRARVLFVAGAFLGTAVLSGATARTLRARLGRRELAYGSAAGLLGVLASGTRVWALRDLDGVIVFPVTTVTVMVLVQVAGSLAWQERTPGWSRAGFAAALLSVLLLSLPVRL